MKRGWIIFAAMVGMLVAGTNTRAEDPAPPRLPLAVEGPVKISPWRAAAEPKHNPDKNHFFYNPPLEFYYYNSGYAGRGYSFSPWYGYGGSVYYLGGKFVSINPYFGRVWR
jgi:hypothetical protein